MGSITNTETPEALAADIKAAIAELANGARYPDLIDAVDALASVARRRQAEPMGITTYDPNIRWAKHMVEITYQQWDFRGTFEVEISGNCQGLDILETVVNTHADQLQGAGRYPVVILRRPAEDGDGEDTLECDADEDSLEAMCVGLRIVGHVEDRG